MAYDGNGNHSLPPGSIVQTGDKVLPSQHNPPLQDISASLSMALVRDGRAPMVGPLPMNGNRITGAGDGVDAGDGATVGQVAAVYGVQILAAPAKATPDDADFLALYSAADANALRRLTWEALTARLTDGFDDAYVPLAREIETSGLATGGGDLVEDRTIDVPKSTATQAREMTDDATAMTPARVKDALDTRLNTASTQNATDLPVGSFVACFVADVSARNRNAVVAPRINPSSASEYTTSGGGALLAGQWRSSGSITAGYCLIRRVS